MAGLSVGLQVRSVDIKPIDQWYQVVDGVDNVVADLKDRAECQTACLNVTDVYNLAADMGGMGFISAFWRCRFLGLKQCGLCFGIGNVGTGGADQFHGWEARILCGQPECQRIELFLGLWGDDRHVCFEIGAYFHDAFYGVELAGNFLGAMYAV